jgi:phospholipid/cholesterol/gamma-HCH transport system substrate-binding protein
VEKRLKTELRVGLFFNLGIALTLVVLFFFGGPIHFFSKKLHYRFVEENAQGIGKGTKVEVAGVRGGIVDQVKIDASTSKVTVDIEIEPHFRSFIREGSYVSTETQGVLADKIVMVQPGSPEKPLLPDQTVLPTRTAVSINQLLAQGSGFLQHLDHLTVGIDQWIDGLGPKDHAKQMGINAGQTMKNLSELTHRLKGLDVRKIDLALSNLDSILGKIDHGSGSLGALVNDPELYDAAKSLMGETNQNRIVRNLVRKSIKQASQSKAEPPG